LEQNVDQLQMKVNFLDPKLIGVLSQT